MQASPIPALRPSPSECIPQAVLAWMVGGQHQQPALVTGGTLKEYQLEGVAWMASLWENGISGILGRSFYVSLWLFSHLYFFSSFWQLMKWVWGRYIFAYVESRVNVYLILPAVLYFHPLRLFRRSRFMPYFVKELFHLCLLSAP